MNNNNYLIIKLGAIGDVVMALPILEAIRKKDRKANIVWLCGKTVEPLLRNFNIDKLLVTDEKKLLKGSFLEKVFEVIRIWNLIGRNNYQVIALGHADKRYKILTFWANTEKLNCFCHSIGKMNPIPGRHHSDEYVRLVEENVFHDNVKSARLKTIQLPINLKNVIERYKNKIVLTPGGAKNIAADDSCRRWPIQNYVQLAKILIEHNYTVIISGGAGDEWVRPYFKGIEIIDFVGKTSLIDLVGLFNMVDCVVTHDSGAMHLAGLATCKIIALFGPTNPYEKVPQRENVLFIWDKEKYACCPCYDGKCYVKCDNNVCLKAIFAEEIYWKIENAF